MVSQILSDLIKRCGSRERPPRRVLFLIWGIILLLGPGLTCARQRIDALPGRDSADYISCAEKIAATSWREALAEPGAEAMKKPPLLLAAMAAGARSGLGAARTGAALMLLSQLLLCCALALLTEEIWRDWRLTTAALLLAAVCPLCVKHAAQILRDLPYWCFAAWAIWFVLRADDRAPVLNWFFAALCCALAIMTRREGFEVAAILGVWMMSSRWRREGWRRIALYKFLGLIGFSAVIMLAVLPVWYRMSQCGSHWSVFPLTAIRYCWSRLSW